MKNIKVSFHHSSYVYKFRIDLSVLQNTNMFSIDPSKVSTIFNSIVETLLLTSQQKTIFDSLSIAFKADFIKRYYQMLNERNNFDFIGHTPEESLQYFKNSMISTHSSFNKCKELHIFLSRQLEIAPCFQRRSYTLGLFKVLYQFARKYQLGSLKNKHEDYTFFYFLACSISYLLNFQKIDAKEKDQVVSCVNKTLALGWQSILNHYNYTHITSLAECYLKIWRTILLNCSSQSWLYSKHENQLMDTSVLRLLVESIKPENKNFRLQSMIVVLLLEVLEKCEGVNELLLFVTECINLRITVRMEQFRDNIQNMKFSPSNTVYLITPKDLTEDMGKKVIRLKQKTMNDINWNVQLRETKQNTKYLINRFTKFKSGKIEIKKQKNQEYRSQRQRIRKQSFIMTNFQEVKQKYEEAHHDDHQTTSKLAIENKQLLQANKILLQKLKDKQKAIQQLELVVAQFVDVRRKYIRQNVLQYSGKVNQYNFHPTSFNNRSNSTNPNPYRTPKSEQDTNQKILQTKRQSNQKIKELLLPKEQIPSNLILPPPPPPPAIERTSAGKSLRGSRSSKQSHNFASLLPPPPPPPMVPGIGQLLLPPPPPPPALSLPLNATPPAKPSHRKEANEKKDIKMINWTAVEISKVKDSFWQSVQQVQFNQRQFVDFFAKKEDSTAEVPKIVVAPMRQKKSLLRPERVKNIQIVLKKTRIAIQKIPSAVEQLNQQVLTSTNADNLLNISPTPEQSQLFMELIIKDPQQWSTADLYFCLITKIQGFAQILRSIKFKSQFEFLADRINQKLSQFESYFQELLTDEFFQSFLSHLLAMGNFMNSDTSRGNAYGFRLESIQKSYMLLGQDRKTSLFQYILGMMVRKGTKLKERSYFQEQKITPLQVLKQDLKEVNKECRNVQECLLMSGEEDLRTPEVFLSFYIESRQKIALMDTKYGECLKVLSKVCEFYCEKMETDRIVKVLNEFKMRALKYFNANKIQLK